MPAQDIMPFASAFGGTERVFSYRMGGGTTDTTEDTSWEVGYLGTVDAAAGDINPHTDGALAPIMGTTYIFAASSANLIQLFNGTSGAATHNILVPCWDPMGGSEFVTLNISDTGTEDTQRVPAGTDVGEDCDFWVDDVTTTMVGHIHGLEADPGADGGGLVVTRVLDDRGTDVGAPNSGTLTLGTARVVFKMRLPAQ